MDNNLMSKTIVFFDGECLICNRFVLLLLSHNERLDYYFAPLFGETFNKLNISEHYLNSDSIVIYKEDQILLHAQAIRAIAYDIGGIYLLINWLIAICPNVVSDYCYKLFASLRFILFDKVNSCSLLPTEQQSRILP